MRHSIYVPATLIVLALGIVAIVKAQDWKAWSDLAQPDSAASGSATSGSIAPRSSLETVPAASSAAAHAPAPFSPAGAAPLPSRFAQGTEASKAAQGTSDVPTLPPLRNSGRFPVANAIVAANEAGGAMLAANQVTDGPSSRRVRSAREPAPRFAEPDSAPVAPAPTPQAPAPLAIGEAFPTPAPNAVPTLSIPAEGSTAITPVPVSRGSRTITTPAPSLTAAGGGVPGEANLLFAADAPAISLRALGPPKITVGKAASYVVEISNSGQADAEDVLVTVDIPSWAEVIGNETTSGSAGFEAGSEAGRVKWNIFRVGAQSREQMTLKLIPRQSRPFELALHWSAAPKSRQTQIEVQEPKLEMLLAGPRDMLYGETKIYSITVSNPGTGPAENVVVHLLPVAPGQQAGGVNRIGTLAPGERKVIELELTARQPGELELRAQAFADGGLKVEATERLHVRRGALEAVISGPQVKYAGTVAAYQLRVANTGDALADNVLAEAILPRNATFVAASDNGLWNAERGRVQWTIGALRPGAARSFEVRCVLADAGNNRIEVAAAADDDLSAAAQGITRVEALADLQMMIADPQGPVPTGEPIVYEVRIVNRGTKAAERVQIAAFFSEGIEPVAVEGAPAEVGNGQVIFQPIQRIVAGQQLVFKITAKADREGNHTFRTELQCSVPETQLAAQETTKFYDNVAEQSIDDPRPHEAVLTPPSRFPERR